MVSRVVSHSLAAQTLPSELQETPSPVTPGTECWILNDLQCPVCLPMTICMRRKIRPVCRKSIWYTQVSLTFQILCQLDDEFLHYYSAFCMNQTAHSCRTINYWRHISMKVTELHTTSHKIFFILHSSPYCAWEALIPLLWNYLVFYPNISERNMSAVKWLSNNRNYTDSFIFIPITTCSQSETLASRWIPSDKTVTCYHMDLSLRSLYAP